MTRLVWGEPGKRFYETGIDRGVFYPQDGVGVPWNGLIAVSEAPSGADIRESYYDGDKTIAQRQRESFAARISAYTYPREFEEYDGVFGGHSQQRRKLFNFSYRTKIGNDTGDNEIELIHLVYNAVATPSTRSYSSIGSGSNALVFEWDIQTIPEILPSGEFSAHLVINSAIAYPWALSALENIIYGSSENDARWPSMIEVINLFENASILRITDNHDGTWTADGPEYVITTELDPWVEKARNLFADPLAKTTNSFYWGSTGGVMANVVDPDGTSWVRFTRQAAGNVRLADIKAGVDLNRDDEYRFIFKLRSSTDRTVTLYLRTAVTTSGSNSVNLGTVSLKAGVIKRIHIVGRMPNAFESTLAGITMTENNTTVGDTLDVTEVTVTSSTPARLHFIHGDAGVKQFGRYRWLGLQNDSESVYEEREDYFEITWPSAIWIDTNTYRVSSL